ncbi:MAG: ABC transporter ATP-binding protein [Armatimonadota bacterium]|nr:ABC transporter ATP-binding protein [Armatimonadota bacterium]MDR7496639.1 ABC transporter ATP-binding protein [Armatimonadota bacterium]
MSDIAIRAEGLGKRYRIGHALRYKALRDSLADVFTAPLRRFRARGRPDGAVQDAEEATIWALKDVSFEIPVGAVVGIIGRNGAGKSTLLKVLSRITEPTEGRAEIRGRVGSLLEVGTGFHPELTGRENVYLNGAILGMRRREIERKFDEIVAFAEVERFIDTPVKYYSSGMYLRLGFSVAAHLEPEILLIDEVLAVGDAAFQRKCLDKMDSVAREGRTVAFVTHNLGALRQLCPETLWVDRGRIALRGGTAQVVQAYLEAAQARRAEFVAESRQRGRTEAVVLRRVAVTDRGGAIVEAVASEEDVYVRIEYEVAAAIASARVGLRLHAGDGTLVFTSNDTDPSGEGVPRSPGIYASVCTIPGNLLNEGQYYVTVACDRPMQEIVFVQEHVVAFSVYVGGGVGGAVRDGRRGVVRPPLQWTVRSLAEDGGKLRAASAMDVGG